MSYSQIKNALRVSKSTLSYWLHDHPLSLERVRELRDWSAQRIERYRETRRKTRETRLYDYYKQQKRIIFPMSERDLFIAGLFLYWGEGTKSFNDLSVSNTNPSVALLFMAWMMKCFLVPKEKFVVRLQLYKDMNIKDELEYWQSVLRLSLNQFRKPYIKKSNQTDITYKRDFKHGTCNVHVRDARLSEQVLMSIKAISDYYMRP